MSDRNKYFEPELGQMAFSNSPWHDLDADDHLIAAIEMISEHLVESGLVEHNPCDNTGAQFECDTFAIRAYCWCDGEAKGHEEGCPPNFEHPKRDIYVAWFKHARRGNSQNRKVLKKEIAELTTECIAIIDTMKEDQENK